MPYYDYECLECGKIMEVFQYMEESELRHHKHVLKKETSPSNIIYCYGPVKRKISVPSLKFVGKGFFINDYPKDSKC